MHMTDEQIVAVLAEHHACRSAREVAAIQAILAGRRQPVLGARPRMRCPECGRDVAQCRDGKPWGHACMGASEGGARA